MRLSRFPVCQISLEVLMRDRADCEPLAPTGLAAVHLRRGRERQVALDRGGQPKNHQPRAALGPVRKAAPACGKTGYGRPVCGMLAASAATPAGYRGTLSLRSTRALPWPVGARLIIWMRSGKWSRAGCMRCRWRCARRRPMSKDGGAGWRWSVVRREKQIQNLSANPCHQDHWHTHISEHIPQQLKNIPHTQMIAHNPPHV